MGDQLKKFEQGGSDEYPAAYPEGSALAGPDQEEGKTPEEFIEYPPAVIVEPDESRSPVELAEKAQGRNDSEAEKGLESRIELYIFHSAFLDLLIRGFAIFQTCALPVSILY